MYYVLATFSTIFFRHFLFYNVLDCEAIISCPETPRSPTLGLVGEAVLSLAYVLVRLFAALNSVLVSSKAWAICVAVPLGCRAREHREVAAD